LGCNGTVRAHDNAGDIMASRAVQPNTVTITKVADGLAYVLGRVEQQEHQPGPRWVYLGSSASREDAVRRARQTAGDQPVWIDEEAGAQRPADSSSEGIGATRPPADS
jgi:hypothetical protein